MNRRRVLAATGAVTAGAVGVVAVDRWYVFPWQERVEHALTASNHRETSHAVEIEADIDDETRTFGPRTLNSGESWTATTLDDGTELSVRYVVDGELAWADTHDIPTLRRGRSSAVLFDIRPDGYEGRILQED